MNKKDFADIRRQFKLDNVNLSIHEIHSAYVKKESGEVLHSMSEHFDRMEEDKQQLYFGNFKKLLSGELGSKLYELDFVETESKECGQKLLYDIFKNSSNKKALIDRIAQNVQYDTDYIITLIYAKYFKPTKKSKDIDDIEEVSDTSYAFDFIMCSINELTPPKRFLKFDFKEKEIVSNSLLDLTINLNSPLDGFMFPAFNDNSADVNRVIYNTKRANCPNMVFVQNVLGSQIEMTAYEEKEKFGQLIKTAIGETVDLEVIHNIYEQINKRIEAVEGSEVPALDKNDIKRILESSGVEEVDKVDKHFEEVVGRDKYEFKATSILPNYTSKSIKINNPIANIAISPKELNNVKQIIRNGKKCLLIELEDDIVIDGFKIVPKK